jgi:hypothetical protein
MKYELAGPFELPRGRTGNFTTDAREKRAFWDEMEQHSEGLTWGCGCYLFSVRSVVWYVGMTDHQAFRQECFQPHKINHINEAIRCGKGPASIFLLPRLTPGGRFMQPSSNGIPGLQDMELLLIGVAIERNGELLNKHSTKVLRESVVPGFWNSPRGCGRRHEVRRFKKIMGL